MILVPISSRGETKKIHKFWKGNAKNTGLELFKLGHGFCRIQTVITMSNAAHHQSLS